MILQCTRSLTFAAQILLILTKIYIIDFLESNRCTIINGECTARISRVECQARNATTWT